MDQQPSTEASTEDPTDALPSVTAVVPTKNRPDLMRRAVQAILDQDYPGPVECIVVFDGTEPIRPEVVVGPNRSLRVLTNTRTPGLAGNRNTGYLAATGDLLASCDDDDLWLAHKLSTQVRLLQANPAASAAASSFYFHHQGRDLLRQADLAELTFADLLRHRHPEANASTYLLPRRLLLDDIGLVDEAIPGGYGEDYELLLRAARRGPIVCAWEPLSRVHLHTQSYFASKWQTIDDALAYLLDRVPEFSDEPVGLARVEGQRAFAQAALGRRREAVRTARRSLRRSPRVRQSWAALLVAGHLVSASFVLNTAQRFGQGI